ncbi:MAG: TnpV protein [Oscillospiraceae bacterium]|nr:TnpV protein [Oscillospiraceae bacterium]
MKVEYERRYTMSINYIRTGDYFIPDLKLSEETRPIGKWGRMHREYLKEHHPIQYTNLVLSGTLWTCLADLNEQAQQRMKILIVQMQSTEGVTEALKAADPIGWTQRMNNITARAEEIIREELIYNG